MNYNDLNRQEVVEKATLEAVPEHVNSLKPFPDEAMWDNLVAKLSESVAATEDEIEEAICSLLDRGMIYEPVLGILVRA